MDDLWFEDELEPSLDAIEAQVKESGEAELTVQELQESARGVVRANMPKWEQLEKTPLTSGIPAVFWKVRLWFEFEPKSERAPFVLAHCGAYLEPVGPGEPMPTVYDLYPQNLFEGEPQGITLKFSPSIEVAGFGVSLGEISTEVNIGQIAPVVVGFTGEGQRAPYWEVRPKKHPLKGIRTFWLVLEQPEGCTGIRLRARVEGIIQTHWGPIAVYPKDRVWDNRPSVVIQ